MKNAIFLFRTYRIIQSSFWLY